MKRSVCCFLCIALACLFVCMPMLTLAESEMAITNVTFSASQIAGDTDTVLVEVVFTAPAETDEVTLLFATEMITDENTQEDKILYIDQVSTPADSKVEFAISKQKVQEATSLTNVNGCTLYMMMGGTDVSEAAVYPVVFQDPYAGETPTEAPENPTEAPTTAPTDAPPEGFFRRGDITGDGNLNAKDVTALRRNIANGLTDAAEHPAMDINGDGAINAKDVTALRRYIANGTPPIAPDMSKEADIIAGDGKNVKNTLSAYHSIVTFDWANLNN